MRSRHPRIWPLVNRNSPGRRLVVRVARHLANGGLAIVPTDTQYALTCDALKVSSVQYVAALKCRDERTPFPVFVASESSLGDFGIAMYKRDRILAQALWPGAFTMVLRVRKDCRLQSPVVSQRGSVGVRVSSEPLISLVCRELGRPLVATSANPSGKEPGAHQRNRWFQQIVKAHSQVIWVKPPRFYAKNASVVIELTGRTPRILRGRFNLRSILEMESRRH